MTLPWQPVLLALVVADDVSKCALTGRISIWGTFSRITAVGFPCTHARWACYCALIDGYAPVGCRIQVLDCTEDENILGSLNITVNFNDPNESVEFGLRLPPITFPVAGEYRFQFYCDDHLIGERRLYVDGPANDQQQKEDAE